MSGEYTDDADDTTADDTETLKRAARRSRTSVYAVHAVYPDEISTTSVIFTSPTRADAYAASVSTDPGVLAGAVTRYVLDTPGERHPESMYVNGVPQEVPHLSDDRRVAANGWVTHPTLRRKNNKVGD